MQTFYKYIFCMLIVEGCRPYMAMRVFPSNKGAFCKSSGTQKVPFPSNYQISQTNPIKPNKSPKECEEAGNCLNISGAVATPQVNGIWVKERQMNGGKAVFKHSGKSLFLHADTRPCCHGNWHINSEIEGGDVYYWAGNRPSIPLEKGKFYVASTSPPQPSKLVILPIPSVALTCEHQQLANEVFEDGYLFCPTGQYIEVSEAIYGRIDGGSQCAPQGRIASCSSSYDVTTDAKRACNNRESCRFKGTNGMYGDPCGGVHKYTRIVFSCQTELYFGMDESSFCQGSFSFADRPIKYLVTQDMVQKAMVWRRKISIAQVMMFNVENTRRSKIFDNIAPLLIGVVSYSTRMKLDALDLAGKKLQGHSEALAFDQFRLWATIIMECISDLVFNAANNEMDTSNESLVESITKLEGHMKLLLSWTIDYPVSACYLSTTERIDIKTGIKMSTIEVGISPMDCTLDESVLSQLIKFIKPINPITPIKPVNFKSILTPVKLTPFKFG